MSEKKYSKKFLDTLFEGKIKRLKGQPSYIRDRVGSILTETAKEYNLTHPIELFTNSKDMMYVAPRRISVALVRDQMGFSYTTLSKLIGYKDPTAVIHAVKIVQEELENSPALCRTVRNILDRVDEIHGEQEDDQSSSL